jgi:hypothetical protein
MEGAGERTSDEMLGPGCISSRMLRTAARQTSATSDKLTLGTFHHTDISGKHGKHGHGIDVEMEAAWFGSRLGRRRSVWYITTADQWKGREN